MRKFSLYLIVFLLIACSVIFLDRCKKTENTPAPNLTVDFAFTGDGQNVPCTVTFTNLSQNATSQTWDFGDNTTAIVINPIHTYTTAGQFTVKLTSNGNGGPLSVQKIVNIGNRDPDGNIFPTTKIGTKIWMAENLKTTHFVNGDTIHTTTPASLNITAEPAPEYQWAFYGTEGNVKNFGRLYTWYAVNDSRKICPSGWHVPTDSEWTALVTYISDSTSAGGKLKSSLLWVDPNTGATNNYNFSGLPGGDRHSDGSFNDLFYKGYFWSATEYNATNAWFRNLVNSNRAIYRNVDNKSTGFSVRCVWK